MRITVSLALFAFGCSGAVELDVGLASGASGAPVQVDTRCDNGGCESGDRVDLVVGIRNDDQPAATVEVQQYRVSYDLPDVAPEVVPYFAAELEVSIVAGSPATLSVKAVGQRQREWILSRAGYDQIDGTATVTLAGYDQDDEVVEAQVDFAIAFGDFVTDPGSQGEGEEDDGGTP